MNRQVAKEFVPYVLIVLYKLRLLDLVLYTKLLCLRCVLGEWKQVPADACLCTCWHLHGPTECVYIL